MTGMNRNNGKALAGSAHLRQSVEDILTTRIGSRVMRRDYGSNVRDLLDAPVNPFFAVDLYIAVAAALAKWEPRIKLSKVSFQSLPDGAELALEGIYLPGGKPFSMEGLAVQ